MVTTKKELATNIKILANVLDKKYQFELNFRNHCYLRIAFDAVIEDKWDAQIQRPFVKFANVKQLFLVYKLLQKYIIDKDQLLADNIKSLIYRKKYAKCAQPNLQGSLF